MLRAGTGRAIITPPLDTPNGIWVAQSHIRPEGLHQDLWVSALMIEDDASGERLVLLDFDLVMLSDRQAKAVRQEVSTATGVPEDHVLPCCTHNHAGPAAIDSYADEGRDRVHFYIGALPAYAAGAAVEAGRRLRAVRIAGGVGESAIGINRDLPLPSGRIVTGPNPDGFADREVRVVRLDTPDGRPYACIVNYQCHATVLGPGNKLISPDYPGTTKRVVEETTGAFCFFMQGAAGNMGPVEGFVADVEVAERLGTMLGLEAARVFTGISTRAGHREFVGVVESGAPLSQFRFVPDEEVPDRMVFRSRPLALPIRHPMAELYEGAERRAAALQEDLDRLTRERADAREIVKARQRLIRVQMQLPRARAYRAMDTMEVEMHALRLGKVGFLLMWGEPYSEIGAEVKRRSPLPDTVFSGYVGGDPVYIPTPAVYLPQPPFEVENSPFAPEAAAITVEAALALLHEVAT
jgi:hypothetical protein